MEGDADSLVDPASSLSEALSDALSEEDGDTLGAISPRIE